jgi:hypothetical protein
MATCKRVNTRVKGLIWRVVTSQKAWVVVAYVFQAVLEKVFVKKRASTVKVERGILYCMCGKEN